MKVTNTKLQWNITCKSWHRQLYLPRETLSVTISSQSLWRHRKRIQSHCPSFFLPNNINSEINVSHDQYSNIFHHTFGTEDLIKRNTHSSNIKYKGSKMSSDRKVALITGITGQDGSYLTELLLEKGYTVSLKV